MEVLVAQQINALNGTMVKISCTFTSCYKLDISKFAMNWTYQETKNDTEEMVRRTSSLFISHLHIVDVCIEGCLLLHQGSFTFNCLDV